MSWVDISKSSPEVKLESKKRIKRNKLIAKKIEDFLNWYVEQPEVKKSIKIQIENEIRRYLYY